MPSFTFSLRIGNWLFWLIEAMKLYINYRVASFLRASWLLSTELRAWLRFQVSHKSLILLQLISSCTLLGGWAFLSLFLYISFPRATCFIVSDPSFLQLFLFFLTSRQVVQIDWWTLLVSDNWNKRSCVSCIPEKMHICIGLGREHSP